ncbi:LLM class flavin-dependent oxidoreductase [Paenibacillus hodogayensis]|uniref:LLM class flavin-dependent oxidoreductase n=1 Tax=Paenibacillus hodogayensis TaxID=279208 RepID=A0ABV5VRA4_9BACL
MSGSKRQMHLGVFLFDVGQHVGGWRHPNTYSDRLLDLSFYHDFARMAERGKFDTILVLEHLTIGGVKGIVTGERPFPQLDTLTVLAAMASVTEKVGLTATLTTTYNDPFHIASRLSTLDLLSGGRAGWNMVTSQDGAAPFQYSQQSLMPHASRYERGSEFMDIVQACWDSWDPEAVKADAAAGLYFDPSKVRSFAYNGRHLSVSGKGYVPSSPQGHPVVFQSGSSESGKRVAAEKAEVVFTAQNNLPDAQTFYASLKGMLGDFGRTSDQLLVLSGLSPILGSTEREAKEAEAYFAELVLPHVAVRVLSGHLDFDLSPYPLDGPLPYDEIDIDSRMNKKARVQLIKDWARRDKLTIRELSKRVVAAGGHYSFVGTPEQLADLMEQWIDERGCDGFNIMPSHFPGGLEQFVDYVVPILQRRGRFRRDYEGSTLRDHLGLALPTRFRPHPHSSISR